MNIANANPYRYVGQYSVQYDQDTKLYFMGWRDYDSTTGRFIVADQYEGDETNPISFNGYLYAEADPVNNIDPDGYAPKWLKKLSKGIKKTAKASYNFVIGDDIKTLTSKNTKWYQKAIAGVSIASNFIPGGGLVSKAAKAVIKGTVGVTKTIKATKAVNQTVKIIKNTAKKASQAINKKPKTPPAKPIQSSKKIDVTPTNPGKQVVPTKSPPKSNIAKTPEWKTPEIRSQAVAGDNGGSMLDKGTVKLHKNSMTM
jgi:RHS repeat-associated protein